MTKRIRRVLPYVVAAAACGGPVEPIGEPMGVPVSVSVSEATLALAAGEKRVVKVTVSRRSDAVRLAATGLPAGVTGAFSPATLAAGAMESDLEIAADTGASAGAATVAVSAVSVASGAAIASANIHVQVCPGYANPTQCPPFPTGGARTITGFVLEHTSNGPRPMAGVDVWSWVQTATYGYTRGRVTSDATGRYSIDNLPDAVILLQAWSAGLDQPCATTVTLSGANASADVEVVSVTTPRVLQDPAAPAFTGVVYEQTAAGRQPVAGVRLYFEVFMDLVAATTTTDADGRYTLCRLPALGSYQLLWVVKKGYSSAYTTVSVLGVKELDLEIVRQ